MSALPATAAIRSQLAGGVLSLTMDRPEARNALTAEVVKEFSAVFQAIRQDRTVRAVVIRGAGADFCAGGDIKGFQANFQAAQSGDTTAIAAQNRRYGRMLQILAEAPQVTIAAVQGNAMGGGMGLVACADVAIAAADAKFGLPEITLGLPPAQVAAFVARRIGLGQMRRFALTNTRLDAAEALRIGLVHVVVPDAAALDGAVAALLKQVKGVAPGAVATTKALLNQLGATPLDSLLDEVAYGFAAAMQGAEAREGVAAFIAKRKPAWAQDP
ncbi:MAG: enoyl-CoA hydratase/isomerase family protein [Alphaproteobacteria bacterium]|nr:enoyl-CoA hydratase/isomerase family protein [Alphaproteobacteria bacterium]